MESVHMVSGWARAGYISPTLHLATAASYSPSPLDLSVAALTECKQSPAYSQEQKKTHANSEEWLDLSEEDWPLNF